jgi:hypothetical protein
VIGLVATGAASSQAAYNSSTPSRRLKREDMAQAETTRAEATNDAAVKARMMVMNVTPVSFLYLNLISYLKISQNVFVIFL